MSHALRLAPGVGALTGPLLAAAVLVVFARTESTFNDVFAVPVGFLVYPLSALAGYDLVAPRREDESRMLRVAGYVAALAAATGVLVAGMTACNALGVAEESPLWAVVYFGCVVGAPAGQAVARGLARSIQMRPWAILVWSSVLLVVGWIGFLITLMAAMFRFHPA